MKVFFPEGVSFGVFIKYTFFWGFVQGTRLRIVGHKIWIKHRSSPQRVYSQVVKIRYKAHTQFRVIIITCIRNTDEEPREFAGGRGFVWWGEGSFGASGRVGGGSRHPHSSILLRLINWWLSKQFYTQKQIFRLARWFSLAPKLLHYNSLFSEFLFWECVIDKGWII